MKRNRIAALAVYLAAGCLAPIQAAKPSKGAKAFIPPPAARAAEASAIEFPSADVSAAALPTNLPALGVLPAEDAVEAGFRIRQAEEHFLSGSALLSKGDAPGARIEFDLALQRLWSAPTDLKYRERLIAKQQELVEAIHVLETAGGDRSTQEQQPVFEPPPLEQIVKATLPLEPELKGKVREQLQSTVSQLPLELADPVLSFINYFSSPRGKGVIEAGLRRSGRYASMIRRILDEEGLPQELIFMAQAESGFIPRAVSYKQASGMWQFVQFRGREYGLMQTSYTDDRLDPEKATRAAARHLRDLYTSFGDWYLAIAAYNCGPMNVEKGVQRTGYADFWEMYSRNVLPRETANYLPIILAFTIMAKNPKEYGLDEVKPEPAIEYDTFQISALTHLNLIADLAGQPLTAIRDLNPAVLQLLAPAGYSVHVPKGAAKMVMTALESIPVEKRSTWRVHRVNAAETISSISRQYHVTEKSIAEANAKGPLDPQPGDLLVIPSSYLGAQTVAVKKTGRTTTAARGGSRTSTSSAVSSKPKAPAKSKSFAAASLTTKR